MDIRTADRLRIGILSLAHPHAETYATLLSAIDDITVRVTDPGPHPAGELRGADLAEHLHVDYADSYESLLAWRPDAVIVASENARHRELVELAASAGAHVLCEKPLATTLEDGEAIVEAADRANVLLMTAFPMRFSPEFSRLRDDVENGRLGAIVSVYGVNTGKLPKDRSWFTDPDLSGGGAIVDHVVHIADLLNAVTGARPTAVTAISSRMLHDGPSFPETAGLVTIAYDDGMVASIDCSWSVPDSAPRWGGLVMHITATSRSVDVDFFAHSAEGFRNSTGKAFRVDDGANLDELMLKAFIEAVRSNGRPQPDGNAGLEALRIVVAAQESERLGQPVALDPRPPGEQSDTPNPHAS